MEKTFRQIDQTMDDAVADLVALCSFASTKDNKEATFSCAEWLKDRFERAGFETRLLQVPGSYPLVYASLDGDTDKRLLCFNHYDVEIIEKPDEWMSPPFDPVVRNGHLYGRGTADNKGNIIARLCAVEATLRTRGSLPYGVVFAVEAKTGIFAPHFDLIVSNNVDLFQADACLWENALNNWDGRPTLRLGDKGMCALELTVQEQRKSRLSSQYSALASGAAWKLIWALSALRTDGHASPEWLNDSIAPLSPKEYALMDNLPIEPPDDSPITPEKLEQNRRLRKEPTCNLSDITAGYGMRKKAPLSAIPETATARIDLRLLPDQHPDRIIEIVRSLVKSATTEIELRVLGKLHPHRTALDDPFVHKLSAAARRVWGAEARPEPLSTASGPRHSIAKHFDIPIVGTGIAYPGSKIGMPNENIRIYEDFNSGIKFIASLLNETYSNNKRSDTDNVQVN